MTIDEEPLDLAALAPDDLHWQNVMNATLARVDDVLVARSSPWAVLATWTRPVLAAAAVAVGLLIPVEIALEAREANAVRVNALVNFSNEAVRNGRAPAADDLARMLAGTAQ